MIVFPILFLFFFYELLCAYSYSTSESLLAKLPETIYDPLKGFLPALAGITCILTAIYYVRKIAKKREHLLGIVDYSLPVCMGLGFLFLMILSAQWPQIGLMFEGFNWKALLIGYGIFQVVLFIIDVIYSLFH